jgi:hypothetical protein
VNAGPAAATTPASKDIVLRYEDLRRHIIEGFGSQPRLGLVVVVREGLAAWMTVCAPAASAVLPAPEPSAGAAAHRRSDAAHADLVHVLTAMALHRFDRRGGSS